jgi:hypothetical protein
VGNLRHFNELRRPLGPGKRNVQKPALVRRLLFIWEAFITSRAGVEVAVDMQDGVSLHEGDALCGALAFRDVLVKEDQFPSDLQHEPALSLIGMHLLETGWSDDRSLMSESCSVLKVRKPKFARST